jgi:hypothetical protein
MSARTNLVEKFATLRQLNNKHDFGPNPMRSKVFNDVLMLQQFVQTNFFANFVEGNFVRGGVNDFDCNSREGIQLVDSQLYSGRQREYTIKKRTHFPMEPSPRVWSRRYLPTSLPVAGPAITFLQTTPYLAIKPS